MIDVKAPSGFLQDKLKQAGKDIPFAMSRALNDVAFRGRNASQRYFSRVLDDPIPFTLNGILVEPSTKRDLKAYVYLRSEVARYLEPQIEGGLRGEKGLESGLSTRSYPWSLSSIGDTLFIPTKPYRRARGGNISSKTARKILKETKKRKGKFFIQKGDDGRPLVFEKMARGPRLALIGIDEARYRKRIDFIGSLQKTVDKTFEKALETSLDKVLPPSDN